MEPKRYSVQHWYPDARDWSEHFATDNLAAAQDALQTADPPDVHLDEYDYVMRHVRRRNRQRLYDIKEERTLQECEPDMRHEVAYKLLIWGLPLGVVLILALWGLSSCGK